MHPFLGELGALEAVSRRARACRPADMAEGFCPRRPDEQTARFASCHPLTADAMQGEVAGGPLWVRERSLLAWSCCLSCSLLHIGQRLTILISGFPMVQRHFPTLCARVPTEFSGSGKLCANSPTELPDSGKLCANSPTERPDFGKLRANSPTERPDFGKLCANSPTEFSGSSQKYALL